MTEQQAVDHCMEKAKPLTLAMTVNEKELLRALLGMAFHSGAISAVEELKEKTALLRFQAT